MMMKSVTLNNEDLRSFGLRAFRVCFVSLSVCLCCALRHADEVRFPYFHSHSLLFV